MKDIFTDFYNKVLGFFRQTEKKEESAKDVACNRLRVVLMQDRTNLSPELMERMRQELIDLLSKYVEMDKEALELNFEQEGSQMALMLSIPVLRAKEESEIEKALAEEALQKDEAAEEEKNSDGDEDKSEELLELSEEDIVDAPESELSFEPEITEELSESDIESEVLEETEEVKE